MYLGLSDVEIRVNGVVVNCDRAIWDCLLKNEKRFQLP